MKAAGRPISLEESIFFAAPGGAMATTQIVLRGALTENECLNWSFTRSRSMEEAAAAAIGRAAAAGRVTALQRNLEEKARVCFAAKP